MKRYRVVLWIMGLALLVVGSMAFWLRLQRKQYQLNRQLIVALVHGENARALSLLEAGADPNTPYHSPPAPDLQTLWLQLLHRTPIRHDDSPTALLIAAGAWWDHDSRSEKQQEHGADASAVVLAALKHEGNLKVSSMYGRTPLIWAVLDGRRDTVRVLLEHGVDINETDTSGWTPLMWSTQQPEMTQLLLELKADTRVQDHQGRTALICAVELQRLSSVQRLLAAGVDPNVRDKAGRTALYTVIGDSFNFSIRDICRCLLEHRADPNLPTKGGDTPLKLARRLKRQGIVDLLLQAGAGNTSNQNTPETNESAGLKSQGHVIPQPQ